MITKAHRDLVRRMNCAIYARCSSFSPEPGALFGQELLGLVGVVLDIPDYLGSTGRALKSEHRAQHGAM